MKMTPTLVDLLDAVDKLTLTEMKELISAVNVTDRVTRNGLNDVHVAGTLSALHDVACEQRVKAEAAAEKPPEEAPDELLRDALVTLTNMSLPMPSLTERAKVEGMIEKLHIYFDMKDQARG